jgi:asparagine synthase (glutamine-hydrolysing)
VAKSYETVHTEIPLPEITADTLVNAVASLDQPLSDPAFIPLHQMSQIVSSDLKVVLSGDGSDELFGGYPRYQVDSRAFPDNWIKKSMRSGQSWGLLPGAITRRALAGREALRYRKVDVDFLPGGRKAFSSWFSEEFLSQLGDYRVMDNWSKELDRLGDDIEGLMKADWITYLSENCLQKTDRATMAFGLEGRVPFLGKAVIDFSERLSSDINFKIGLKSLPMALAEAHLPSAVWDRPKHGFTVPVSHLFRSSWRELALDMVSKLDKLAPFTNVSTCRKLIRDAVSGSAKNHALAYSLLVYLIWAEAGTIKAVSSGHKQ